MSSSDGFGTDQATVRKGDEDAWAPTLAADQAESGRGRTPAAPSRSTVLPRVVLTSGHPELVNETRPRFEEECLLGEGGMGQVVRARDHDIARKVAIKRLHPTMCESPAALRRFAEEIRTVGALEHPNIVPIHDVGVDEQGNYFFVMKYLDGETLESIIERLREGRRDYQARYSFEARTRIFLGVLRAVAYAHERGIIHRDLKPANIMVGNAGEVMVMDWGIAKRFHSGPEDASAEATPAGGHSPMTRAGSLLGTPAYMSPEQTRAEPATERSDIYTLSVIFHELLCLEHPIAETSSLEDMLRAVRDRSVPLTSSVKSPHQPPPPMDLTWFIRRGVQKDPRRRYQSVREMIDRLELRAEGIVPIQCHITFTQRMVGEFLRFVNRHPLAFTAALGLTVVTVVAAVVAHFIPH
jgi:eukaryotic-like serine/threonine-protein kinase